MVRWIDGFYGGLVAGVTSALFYTVVAVAWLHEVTLDGFFAQAAQALPPFHGAPVSWALVGLGVVLYFALAAAFGIVYALLASRLRSMWRERRIRPSATPIPPRSPGACSTACWCGG